MKSMWIVASLAFSLLTAVGIKQAMAARASALAQSPHGFLHINCPPGSHVSKSRATFGKKLAAAREASLAERSITAFHPKP